MTRAILFLLLAAGCLYVFNLNKSVRVLRKFLLNFLLSLVVIIFLSIIGEYFGFHLTINLASVLLIALLGLPGLGVLGMLHFLLG